MESLTTCRNECTLFTFEENILHHLMLRAIFLNRNGLLYGKMGIVLAFFEYGKNCNNTLYLDFANELKDSVYNKINDAISLDFATGLCGVGWGIEYMVHNQFSDTVDCDICTSIDQRIMMVNMKRITDFSFETGLEGFLHYILIRIKGSEMRKTPNPFDAFFLKDLYDKIQSLRKDSVSIGLKRAFISYIDTGSLNYYPDISSFTNNIEIHNVDDILSAKLGLTDGLAGKVIRIINDSKCIQS